MPTNSKAENNNLKGLEIETQIKDVRELLVKFLDEKNLKMRAMMERIFYSSFDDIYNYLQEKTNFLKDQVAEGPNNDSLFHDLAEGYWRIGFYSDKNFMNLAEKFYSLWLAKAIEFQNDKDKRLHKGTQYHQLGWIFENFSNNKEKAYSYYLYGLTEDIFSDKQINQTQGFKVLVDIFNFPRQKVNELQNELLKLNPRERFIPEKALQLVRKKVLIPNYEEIQAVDVNIVKSLRQEWEKLKKENEKKEK